MSHLHPGFYADIMSRLKEGEISSAELSRLKVQLCRKHGLARIPTDIELFLNATGEDLKRIRLVTKPTRTISGVAVVALMSAPLSCPHGRCTFCPGGPNSVFGDVPQSYTGKEPSTMRAIRAGYDPYLIVFNRLEQYAVTGHNFEKIEMIVQGGTFPSYDESYQEEFVGYAFKAMNDFSELFFNKGIFDFQRFKDFFELPGSVSDAGRYARVKSRILALNRRALSSGSVSGDYTFSLEAEQLRNEKSMARCVALCVETKPDFCKEEHIDEMLKCGTTRVELGVQSLQDSILKAVNRGHLMSDTIEATSLLKDSFLKVGYHLMPGLPGSSREGDIDAFREIFSNPDFKPDSLKVYPCMVMPGTELVEDWKAGRFHPLTTKQAADIIVEGKRFIPEYCRVMRVQRDIPTYVTSAGVDRTNLRQYVDALKGERNVACRCIRCREPRTLKVDFGSIRVKSFSYDSGGGREIFISAEDTANDLLLGFCRLRIPGSPFRKEITPDSAGVRELHVFGPAAGLKSPGSVQHRGLGKQLVTEAERIAAMDYGCGKMLVISGIGAREYYRKLGYRRDGAYMSKEV